MHSILNILYLCTVRAQRKDMTISDFYGEWLLCRIKLEKYRTTRMKTNLATKLIDGFNNRRKYLFEDQASLACILLDPRYNKEVQDAVDISKGKMFIEKLYIKMLKYESDLQRTTNENVVENEQADEIIRPLTDAEMMEQYFEVQGFRNADTVEESRNRESVIVLVENIRSEIIEYMKLPRLGYETNPLEFWTKGDVSQKYPGLSKVALAIYAIPSTEVTVERASSAMALILTDKRTHLLDQRMEELLLIRLNNNIAIEIFEKELQNIAT